MDEGLCGLLSIKAVPLQEKAPAGPSGGWRRTSASGPPVCGKGLRAALVFGRAPKQSVSRPPRLPLLSSISAQANGLEALLRPGVPADAAATKQPSLVPPAGETLVATSCSASDSSNAQAQRLCLPRREEFPSVPPKAAAKEATTEATGACGGERLCAEVAWPPLAHMESAEAEATADDELEDCGETDVPGCEEGGLRPVSGSSDGADEDLIESDAEDLLAADEAADRSDGGQSDEDEASVGQDDEAVQSDASSDTSEKEAAAEASPEALYKDDTSDVLVASAAATGPAATPRKKKKRRKRKRRGHSGAFEEPKSHERKPAVPRFPHPLGVPQQKNEADLLPVAASTVVPIIERSPAAMKERLSRQLFLGRFPRRPVASMLNESLDDGVAHAASEGGGGGASGSGDAAEDGGDMSNMPAALEASNTSWASRPRRSQSHDGSAARAARAGISHNEIVGEAWRGRSPPRGTKASAAGDRGRASSSTSGGNQTLPRLPRARSEVAHGGDDSNEASSLSITGHQPKATGKKLAVGSRQWLVAAAAEQKKQAEENGNAALGALYFSFSSMKDPDGRKVALKNRDKVVRTLHELNTKVAIPLCRHFGLRYNFFSEHHCQAKKAGVTVKEPLVLRKQLPDGEMTEETRYLVTIRLRVRVHPTKGDPQSQFISRGTQLAVLLHELCHLKHMNHGKDFMLFLREVFAQATKLGVFNPSEMCNEIPSPWPWENEIFRTGGEVCTEVLMGMYHEHKALQREKAKAAGDESARKAAEEAEKALGADLVKVLPALDGNFVEGDVGAKKMENRAEAELSAPSNSSFPTAPDMETQPPPVEEKRTEVEKHDNGIDPELLRRKRAKAFCGSPTGTINLTAAFQKGHTINGCTDGCCLDMAALPDVLMEYGAVGDSTETETNIEFSSVSYGTPSPPRARSLSRGGSSSVVKLPQIPGLDRAASSPPLPSSPTRARRSPGIPTLPPV